MFIRDVLKVKLQLGYLLFFITVAAILFSARVFVAPGAVHTRVATALGSAKQTIIPTAAPQAAHSSAGAPDPPKPLSINAPQLASIQRYMEATSRICSSQVSSAIGTDPKLGIESDIAQWCGATHVPFVSCFADLPTQQVPGFPQADAG